MVFTVADADELLRVLRENPELRAAARREILGEELLSLPDLVRQNSANIHDLRDAVADLRSTASSLSHAVQDLLVAVRLHDQRLTRFGGQLGEMHGALTESRWAGHFSGRFGHLVRRARMVNPSDLDRFEEADEAGSVTDTEALGVRRADLLIRGVRGRGPDRRDILLVVEVSTNVEQGDVDRAVARAGVLRAVGYPAEPAVAGARMDASLRDEAVAAGVHVVLRPDDLTRWATLSSDSDEPATRSA